MFAIAGEWGGVPTERFFPTKYFCVFIDVDVDEPGALEIELIEQFEPNLLRLVSSGSTTS